MDLLGWLVSRNAVGHPTSKLAIDSGINLAVSRNAGRFAKLHIWPKHWYFSRKWWQAAFVHPNSRSLSHETFLGPGVVRSLIPTIEVYLWRNN
jgi:hypothetical protein